jgi:pimeloyl-ACP methyl ester carboxylesterase
VVGQSFGGLPAVHYAGRYPDEVAGLVLLDVPPPDPNLTAEIAPEAAWDHPANLERVDALDTERRLAEDRLPIDPIPVTIVSATDGASGPAPQEYWLRLSPEAEQVVLEGGHDLHLEDAEEVSEQILATLRRAEGS